MLSKPCQPEKHLGNTRNRAASYYPASCRISDLNVFYSSGAEESSGMRADVLETWLVCLEHNIPKSRGPRTRAANLAVLSPDWTVACMLSLANAAQPIRRWPLA